jgi:hypothetical protein
MKINGLYLEEKTPDSVVGGCIEIFERAWPVDPRHTIDVIERECLNTNSGVSWKRAGTVGAGAYQNARTNLLMDLTYTSDITQNPIIRAVHNMYYSLILAASNSYVKRYDVQEPLFHEGYQLLKYNGGQEYHTHYDGSTRMGRCLSAICYLNNDYVGGEIEFVNFGVKIKPEPGMLIIFPSNYAYAHKAHPVISGTKYAIVTWIRDRITNE